MGPFVPIVKVGAAIAFPLAIAGIAAQHFTIMLTNSLPPGLYAKWALPPDGPRRGDIVTACVPEPYAQFGRHHGFLDSGFCNGTEQILKIVEAVPGDCVQLSPNGVFVNGKRLQGSTPAAISATGVILPHVAFRTYHLTTGQFWLGTPKPDGFDSRYFGVVTRLNNMARPLITFYM